MKIKIVSSGKGLHSPEFYKKKKTRKRIKRIFLGVAAAGLLGLLVWLVRLDTFLISKISVVGSAVERDAMVAEVQSGLAGNYGWVVPRANAFFYPQNNLQATLVDKFPGFKSIDVGLEGLNTLVVTVEERKPFALYCAAPENCYVMDAEGFVFSDAGDFSGDVYLPHYLETPLESPIGAEYLAPGEFSQLSSFISSLAPLEMEPVSVMTLEREYRLTLSTGSIIMWQRSSDPALVRANLGAFLSSEPILAEPNFLERIESLDLRTEDKVFYRFRDEE